MVNIEDNQFEALNDHQTRWTAVGEFHFGGIMRLISFFMPCTFRKQSHQHMNQFKEFAETEFKKAS